MSSPRVLNFRSRGFTLIELLVVIAIIGILITILLPAIQKARGVASAMRCRAQMRELSTALHVHHNERGAFPIASDTKTQLSWHVELLPYIEQTALYEQFSKAAGAYTASGKNNPHGLVLLRIYQCPLAFDVEKNPKNDFAPGESVNGQFPYTTHFYGIGGPTGTNASTGGTYATTGSTFEGVKMSADGMWNINRAMKIEDCLDGMSNTMLLGEMSWRDNVNGTRYRTWVRGSDQGGVCAGIRNVTIPINKFAINPYMDMPMGSGHNRGANFSFGDNTVRFIRDTIAMDTYKAMASRNGNETASE